MIEYTMALYGYLHITLFHYHHYAGLFEVIELLKCLSYILWLECVSKIRSLLEIISHAIYGAVYIQFTHFSYDDCENSWTWSYYHHKIGSMTHLPLFRVKWCNNSMRCMSFYILTVCLVCCFLLEITSPLTIMRFPLWVRTFHTQNSPFQKKTQTFRKHAAITHSNTEGIPTVWTSLGHRLVNHPDSKVRGANMGPTWVLSAPDGPHVGSMSYQGSLCVQGMTWVCIAVKTAPSQNGLKYQPIKMRSVPPGHGFVMLMASFDMTRATRFVLAHIKFQFLLAMLLMLFLSVTELTSRPPE